MQQHRRVRRCVFPEGYALFCAASIRTTRSASLDCMKMWPCMRDLPTSVWAGHGWAFDENGLRRLSSSGGSHAMEGVEVFESVGLAAEQVKPSNEKIRDTPIAVAAEEHPPPLAEGQKPSRFQRINVAKQSGDSQCPAGRITLFRRGRSTFTKLTQQENAAGLAQTGRKSFP